VIEVAAHDVTNQYNSIDYFKFFKQATADDGPAGIQKMKNQNAGTDTT